MRTDTPRLPPLRDDELDDEQEAILAPFRERRADTCITRALLRHPAALKAFNVWATHVFLSPHNTLTLRDRELMLLRTAWCCRSGYEWARHVPIARKAGMSDAEIDALKRPKEEGGWNAHDAALIAATDELTANYFVSDAVWTELAAHFDDRQCMDILFAIGLYAQVAMFLNAAGVPIDADLTPDPDLVAPVRTIAQ